MNEAQTQLKSSELLHERFAQLPDEITDIISYGILDQTITGLSDRYDLTEQERVLLENNIILVLLMFLPRSELAQHIEETLDTDTERASALATEINEQIFSLVEGYLDAADEELFSKNTPDTKKPPTPQNEVTPVPPPAEEEAPRSNSNIEAMRTFDSDAKKVHGYGAFRKQEPRPEEQTYSSSQDEVLNKERLANTPTYGKKEDESS